MKQRSSCLSKLVLLLIILAVLGIVLILSGIQLPKFPIELGHLFSPSTPTIIPLDVIRVRVRELGRLETVEYTQEAIISAESCPNLFGMSLCKLCGDKLLLVASGKVIAGIDLTMLGQEDIQMQDGVLTIMLPEPEVFDTPVLDNQKTHIYDRGTCPFAIDDKLETEARQAAEEEIKKAAIEGGILDTARQNGEKQLSNLLEDFGITNVKFVYPSQTPTPVP
jgi:hypothetical protein